MENDRHLNMALIAASLALDLKADNVIVLDVRELTSYTDFFVIASASSERQTSAIASSIEDGMRKAGVKPISVEGKQSGNWVLIDYGDVVAHIFLEEARDYYDLEGFWIDAPRMEINEEEIKKVHEQWEKVHSEDVAEKRVAL